MKHALWWLLAVMGLTLSTVAFLAHAPSAAKQAQAAVVTFTPLASGTSATAFGRVDYRITSTEDLAKLWKMLGASSTPPAVDFSREEVLAVFAPAPRVEVAAIEDAATRMVKVEIRSCGTASSTAYELVTAPATSLSYTHADAAGCN